MNILCIYIYTHRPLYWVHLFNCLVTQIANQPITWQQLNAFRHLDVVKTTCWSSNRASERGRKGFKRLWTWNGCWCRRAGLSISQTADLLGFSHTTRRTLKQMGSSSRRPHRCRSCQLRTGHGEWRLQFTQDHQNWTIEDWKNVAWSDESWFLLHSDDRVIIWHKEHESMDPSCLVSTVQGGVMVWGIFSCHTLGPLVPIEHHLNTTVYLSIVADHVHLFMTTVYPSSDASSSIDNAACHKAQIISDWFLEHDNEFTLLK